MGGLLDKLTKTGTSYPGGATKFYDSPDDALSAGNQALQGYGRPQMVETPPNIAFSDSNPQLPAMANSLVSPEPQPPSMQVSGGGPQLVTPPANLPSVTKPSFQQASTDATGLPAAVTPGLTRAGKLMQILGLAAKGGLAGQAASEQMVAQSGGRRAGGAGIGFEGGLQEPARELEMKQQAQHGGLENQMVQAQVASLPWLRQAQMQRQQAQADAAEARAKLTQWQIENPKATDEEKIGAKQKIALAAGLDPEETKQFVYGIKPTADKAAPNPTEASLAAAAATGDPVAEKALKRLDQSKLASRSVTNIMTRDDAKDIADAIENGDQPPTVQGLYRNAGPVRAELARRGVPLAKMETDWKATQKFMSTLNGPQQLRLQQSIGSANDMLDKIEGLYNEWKGLAPVSGFKIANKASLIAAKNVSGRVGAVAQALDAQIADLTADLGNIYMGGNSPTDHALGLAAKNLSSDWGPEQFEEGLKQARANVKIRNNSIMHSHPAGVSGQYMPANSGAAPIQPATSPHTIKIGAKQYQYNGSGDTADLKNYTELK